SQATNPDFETWLERQYLDPVMHRLAAYTGPERDLIRRLPALRMVFVRNIPPLVEKDKEGLRGIYPDILRQLAKDSGVTFDFIAASSMEEATRMIDDGIADMTLAVYNRETFRQGMFFTNAIWTDTLSIVSRKDEEIPFGESLQIAIPEWMHGAREYIQRRHSNWTILEYDDVDACLYSVSQNICTLAMIPETVLHYEDTLLTYPSLQRITAPDSHANLPVCIAISANQPRLLQEIADKAILHMNSEVLNQIVQQNMSRRRLSLRFFLSRYPLYTAGAIIFFVLGGAVTAFFAYFARMKNQQAKTLNEKNEELRTAFRALDEKNNELQMALRARNSAQREAETDTLTGLLTRVVIENVCKHFLTEADEGTTFAFFIVDLDHFKEVNDTHGHQAGDAILKGFSQALLRIFRRTDCIGRFGGDEFVIFAPYITKGGDIERLCQQILEAARGLSIPDGSHPVTASIGISLAPAHGRTYQTIFQAADTALYHVKESGRNGFAVYRPDMAEKG
ncbi:MAG: GGDEF domain-containing protein, partial [Schwartzia sp.]|nr:GGDEF domain-containing protein [Schwartzia sp. (in: firmicutes)]